MLQKTLELTYLIPMCSFKQAETEAFISLIEKGHRCPEEKLGPDGLRSIYVGEKEFPGGWNRCYILVRKDRSEDDCSYVKLLRNIDRSVS